MKNYMKIMDRMTPCFDLNERKEKMKKHLKTLTALGLICSILNAAQAEESLKTKEEYFSKDSFQRISLKAEGSVDSIKSFVQDKIDEIALAEPDTSKKANTLPTYAFKASLQAMQPQFENLMTEIRKTMSVKADQA